VKAFNRKNKDKEGSPERGASRKGKKRAANQGERRGERSDTGKERENATEAFLDSQTISRHRREIGTNRGKGGSKRREREEGWFWVTTETWGGG